MHEARTEETKRRSEGGRIVQWVDGEIHWEVSKDKRTVFVLFDFGEERGQPREEHREVQGLHKGWKEYQEFPIKLLKWTNYFLDDL